jgi:cardiolipin synthase
MIPLWVWSSLAIVSEVLAFAVIIVLLRRPREPRAMLVWILVLILLPVLGLIFFATLSEPRREWHRVRRRRSRRRLQAFMDDRSERLAEEHTYDSADAKPSLRPLINLTERLGAYLPTHGNEVAIYQDAERTFTAIQSAIASARSHVHLEYYIFQPDETGAAVRDLLIQKTREGVECRLLLDYIGCWWIPGRFLAPLRQAGVQVAWSLPMLPFRGRWHVNFRNHRKIAIIDGRIGFTGSQNIGDEYRGRLRRLGPWRDTHVGIEGPAVLHLQEVFAHDWFFSTKQELVGDRYFPDPQVAGDHIIQIAPSGPDQREHVLHQLLLAAVNSARSSVCIITPYFVPDSAMILALQSAAYRGVRVRLLIPSNADHRVVLWAGRSFYHELFSAGVEIHEHDGTMLHSKVVILDEDWAMVGSANMDERSFRLNYELTTNLYSRALAEDLFQDFESLIENSRRVTPTDPAQLPFGESIRLGLARLASPML